MCRGSASRKESRAGSTSNRYARAGSKASATPGRAPKAGLGFAAGSGSRHRVAGPRARLPLHAGRLERACQCDCAASRQHSSMNRTSRAASGRSRHVTCAGTPSRPPRTSSPRLSEILAGYLPRVQRSACQRRICERKIRTFPKFLGVFFSGGDQKQQTNRSN
jgi:hypothetical protein